MNGALLSAFLFAAAMPPFDCGFLLVIAWVPLFLASAGARTDKSAGLAGALFGAVYYALVFRWMVRLQLLHYVGTALLGAVYGAGIAACVRRATVLPRWARAAAAALAWILPVLLADNPVRPFFGSVVLLTGLHALPPAPLLQLASAVGETGLVFFFVLVNGLLAQAISEKAAPRRAGACAGAALALLAGSWAWGAARMRSYDAAPRPSPSFRLACAQTDLPFAWKWRANHQDELFSTYESMALEAAAKGANMVLFPQYQIPEDIYRQPGRWAEIARKAKAYVALGTDSPVEPFQYGKEAWVMALVFSPEGKIVGTQVALHPSPVGRPMTIAGTEERPVPIPGLGKVALLPCFDDVTSRPARLSTRAGADILLSMANDGLFKGTNHPRLHMIRARLRAVENRKYLVRCIPNGISAVIDPLGRVRDSIPEGKGLLFAQW